MLKKFAWPVLFLALCFSSASARITNNPENKKVHSAIEKAVEIQTARLLKQPCTRCGEEITDPHQHCRAADYADLCTARPSEQHEQNAQAQQNTKKHAVCTRCGEEITEPGQHCRAAYYADLCTARPSEQHEQNAQAQQNTQKHAVCARCGEEITDPHQHCRATDSTELCIPAEYEEVCTECGRTREEVAKSGHHHKPPYTFEKRLKTQPKKPVLRHASDTAKTTSQPREERCPECGRTREQVEIHGHNHKPPYTFQ